MYHMIERHVTCIDQCGSYLKKWRPPKDKIDLFWIMLRLGWDLHSPCFFSICFFLFFLSSFCGSNNTNFKVLEVKHWTYLEWNTNWSKEWNYSELQGLLLERERTHKWYICNTAPNVLYSKMLSSQLWLQSSNTTSVFVEVNLHFIQLWYFFFFFFWMYIFVWLFPQLWQLTCRKGGSFWKTWRVRLYMNLSWWSAHMVEAGMGQELIFTSNPLVGKSCSDIQHCVILKRGFFIQNVSLS